MGADSQIALPWGRKSSLPDHRKPASKVDSKPPMMIGRRRPQREVLLSDQAPTSGPVKNPTKGPAVLFRVANQLGAPRCVI